MRTFSLLLALLLICSSAVLAQVGFNNDGSQPDPSAGLDIKFPDKGLLIPRVMLESTSLPNPVTAPALGLLVINLATAGDVTPGFYFWSGSSWMRIGNVSGSGQVNYIPRWIAPGKLANSQLYENNIGDVGIGTTNPGTKLDVVGGSIRTEQQLISTVGFGTSPLMVNSSTRVDNLNADLLDGYHSSDFSASGHNHTLNLSGDITGSGNVTGSWATTLANSGVTAGNYGAASGATVPYFTVDYKGRLTAAASRNITSGDIGAWSTTGNAGTNVTNNFIGTTDAQWLGIRTNNVERFRITLNGQLEPCNTGGSVFIGENAGANDDLSNNENVFIGRYTGFMNNTGYANTAIGAQSLVLNTSGAFNTALGYGALLVNATGNSNTATGVYALYANDDGGNNTANGLQALYFNTNGNFNTAMGYYSLLYNNGSDNTASGNNSLSLNTSGNENAAFGSLSLDYNTTGSQNTAIGYNADVAAVDLTNATAIGANATVAQSNALVLGNNADVGIGTSTPGAKLDVAGGNIRTNSQFVSTVADGTPPLSVTSTTLVSNLNSDRLDGQHASEFAPATSSTNYIQNQTAADQAADFRISGNGIFNGGNVGIGTLNPAGDLHINRNGDALLILEADANNNYELDNPRFEMRQDGGLAISALGMIGMDGNIYTGSIWNAVYLMNEDNAPLQFGTNNTFKMTILSDGKTGIGTTSPVHKLDVVGGSIRTDNKLISSVATGTAPLEVSSSTMVNNLNADMLDGQHASAFAPATSSTNYIQNQTAADQAAGFRINGNGIFNGGKLGIGTTTPELKLSVIGGQVLVDGSISNGGIYFRPGTTTGSPYNCSILAFSHAGSEIKDGLSINGYDGLSFCTGSNTRQERMRIVGSTGMVGIGTETPVATLDVNGDTHLSGNLDFSANDKSISLPQENGNNGSLTISAGGVVASSETTFWGGNLNLKAGNGNSSASNVGGDVNIYAGDNLYNSINNGNILFYAGDNQPERMRIDGNTGNVGIGNTSPSEKLDVSGNARIRGVTSGTYNAPLNITSTGVLTTSTSDIRMKTHVESLDHCLDKVMNLRGVRFNWKEDPDGSKKVGFIAQEVEQVLPEVVITNPTDGFKGVNYGEVTSVLVEAVKELRAEKDAEIAALKLQNQDLKSANEAMKNMMESMKAEIDRINSYLEISSQK